MNVNQIIAYESGELDEEEILDLFQDMINSGVVWQLQGHYGRMASNLLEQGLCVPPEPASYIES